MKLRDIEPKRKWWPPNQTKLCQSSSRIPHDAQLSSSSQVAVSAVPRSRLFTLWGCASHRSANFNSDFSRSFLSLSLSLSVEHARATAAVVVARCDFSVAMGFGASLRVWLYCRVHQWARPKNFLIFHPFDQVPRSRMAERVCVCVCACGERKWRFLRWEIFPTLLVLREVGNCVMPKD